MARSGCGHIGPLDACGGEGEVGGVIDGRDCLREGLRTAVSHGLWLNIVPDYDAPTQLGK
ncbi:UDP-arabinopyranose mutase 1-like [Panicum miliaceum]|uniref:UDP-arabinopyranose mutase 1-like n=1 Tax=Panicum miliaceum TaxID=4540 RepID=A0A3L6PD47_PANMI|nr:UDP-arabinopyranose mutase 1-like [Panicum miliaceum]